MNLLHKIFHVASYVLWATSGFLLFMLIALWVFDAFGLPVPFGIPADAFEPLTIIAGSVSTFAGGMLARWGSNQMGDNTPYKPSVLSNYRYLRAYQQHIYYQHRYFDVKGIKDSGKFAFKLEQMFVELSVGPSAIHPPSVNPIATVPDDLQTGQHTIWQFLAAPQMQDQSLAIIGAPGSGKTTLMKHIALALATRHKKRRKERKNTPNLVPVMLFLRHLAPAVAHAQNQHRYATYETGLDMLKAQIGPEHLRFNEFLTYEQRLRENLDRTRRFGNNDKSQSDRNEIVHLLNEFATATISTSFNEMCIQQHEISNQNAPRLETLTLEQAIGEQIKREGGQLPPLDWFKQQLSQGRCLVMFDGLDEVADPNLRRAVVEWVERQMKANATNRFLVTSRPHGYTHNPLEGVTVLAVQSFTHSQVKTFVHNWYLSNEIMSTQNDDAGVHQQAHQKADDLLRRLDRTPALSELAVNPLLLTLITTVHCYRRSLPGRRVELYAEICEVFLGKHKQAHGIELDLTPSQKQSILQPLAYHMMCREVREISTDEALMIIHEPLKLVGSKTTDTIFLKSIEEQSGLLLEQENGVYGFAHLTFQEYLAATHINENNLDDILVTHIDKEWWYETIRLFVAQSDASPIVTACLAHTDPSVAMLALAVDCREEAMHLQEELRTRVEQVITRDLEHSDPARRRLAAQVCLARRLRNLHRIDEQHEIDTSYLTCAEYQLFLNDILHIRKKRLVPDHWTNDHFPPGNATMPITGVHAEDAEEFCVWLTQQYGDGMTFRLPTQVECDVTPHRINTQAILAAWCKDLDTFSLYGITPAQQQAIIAQLEDIRNAQGLDIPCTTNLALNLDFPQNLAFALALVHEYTRELHLNARTLAKDLVRELHAFDGNIQARAHKLVRSLIDDRYNKHTRDHVQSFVLDIARNRSFQSNTHLTTAHYIVRHLACTTTSQEAVLEAIDARNYYQVKNWLNTGRFNATESSIAKLLKRLFAALLDILIVGGKEAQDVRKIWRHYAVFLLQLAWLGFENIDTKQYTEERYAVLDACWWLHIVMAREEGLLPSWEGIRIVRERK